MYIYENTNERSYSLASCFWFETRLEIWMFEKSIILFYFKYEMSASLKREYFNQEFTRMLSMYL